MWLRLALCLTCLLALPSLTARALADDRTVQDDVQAARSLFEEGLRHVDAQQWSEAEAKFRQALALRDSPVIRYNLAVTLAELQQLVEARHLLESIDRDVTTSAALREKVPELLETVRRRSVKLTIRLDGATEDAEVMVDGRALPPDELERELLLDPGRHVVVLQRGGTRLEERQLELPEGVAQVIALRLPEQRVVPSPVEVASQAESPPPMMPGPRRDDRETVRSKRRWWILGVAGVVVTTVVLTGVVMSARGRRGKPSYEGDFDPPVIGVEVPR